MPKKPCEQCPWRTANHGKRSPGGFYTKANLRRLWKEIRGGGGQQSCHLTDPNHPDHVAAGAPENAKPKECPGSVILVLREFRRMAPEGTIGPEQITPYLKTRRKGLTRRGILYWALGRMQFGGTMMGAGPKLPEVEVDDPAIGLPEFLS